MNNLRLFDFTGGLVTKSPVTSLKLNQSLDCDNINLLPSGGFEKRRGNVAFNATVMTDATTVVGGLGYFRLADATEALVCVAGAKIFKADSLDGAMDDISAALTVAASSTVTWTLSMFNNIIIGVGGTPNAPFKWTGTGDAAVLGGSPPSGSFGLAASQRFFIGGATATPSQIKWSIIGNPEDWSASGSGTQNVQLNDGDYLVNASLLNNDHLILFKQHSMHDLVIRTNPFPLVPLFRNIGAVGKHAIVSAGDGLIYFVTPEARMKATNGSQIFEFPDTIDDIWDGLSTSRLKNIQGIYNPRLHQVQWFCSNGTSSTNNYCIVWDIRRQCWLRHSTGHDMNVVGLMQNTRVFGGSYVGKIYELDKKDTYNDDSETSPGSISAYWRTGWYDLESMINGKYFPYVDLSYKTQSSGNFKFSYGFDFAEDSKTETISMQSPGDKWDASDWDNASWGGQLDYTDLKHTKGMGKYIQFCLKNDEQGQQFAFNGLELPVLGTAPTKIVK